MNRRSKINLLILFFLIHGSLQAQQNIYKNEMHALYKNIQKKYFQPDIDYYKEHVESNPEKKVAFVWSMAALWQADNEVEAIDKNAELLDKDLKVINKYFDTNPPAAGYDSYPSEFGRGDRFYDDNQWLGLTAVDAYNRTRNKSYLNFAKLIYRFMMTGYDTVSGGGLYWKEGDKTTKNTCSNGPGIVLALKLYKATKDKHYLDTALLLYKWVNKHLQDQDGLYFDNIKVKTGQIEKYKFSYNSGTMLQANVCLYEITHDQKYLTEAIRIADAAEKYFYASGKFRDDYWFNVVLLRGYQQLLNYNAGKQYIHAFQKCVDNAIRTDFNSFGLIGKLKSKNLVEQGGMLEILARFAQIFH
ncbi:MAG: glycoside hydrolase family 76 protein [Arachidicoccus sp.]|nr:glycoside hydrolase family 76 protein [Arachidicoccus sp.]